MRVLVSGASGLVGSALVPSLDAGGHSVSRLVRRAPRAASEIGWDPVGGVIDRQGIAGFDAVVHLAGESIAAGRWTRARKARIRDSRVRGTRLLSESLARAGPPGVMISASAVGYYGDRGDERLSEDSGPGRGFLADVAREWEAAVGPVAAAGTRVVVLRTGIVLSPRGGALARLLPVFRLGLGGPIGDGRAWWSWIALDDLVGIVEFAMRHEGLRGPVNATSPAPATNAEFAAALGSALGRPAALPVPRFALRLAFGQMADEALLASARVEPDRLARAGYAFRLPALATALRHMLRPAAARTPRAGA